MITGNSYFLKRLNQMVILRTIQKHEPTSRQALAKETGMSNSTISVLVAELISSGIIKETGVGGSIGGRRPIMIGINDQGGYILGVDVGSSKITCGIVSLRAQVLETFSVDTPKNPKESVISVIEIIQNAKKVALQKGIQQILGVGVAAPGFVDLQKGIVVTASNLGWKNVELKKEIEYRTGLKAFIDNNANTEALGEHYYGVGSKAENILYLSIGKGIGAGIIVDGRVMEGVRNASGEIGHMKMVPDGPICTCGRVGCLEALSSAIAIEREATKRMSDSIMLQQIQRENGSITAKDVFECAQQEDSTSAQILDQAFMYLSMAAGNLVNIFNPEMIIFGGGMTKAGDFFLNNMKNRMKEIILSNQNEGLEYGISSLGDDNGVLGAATLVVQELFRPVPVNF